MATNSGQDGDRSLFSDGLYWWSVIILSFTAAAVVYNADPRATPEAVMLDVILAVAINWAIFVWVPAWIRKQNGGGGQTPRAQRPSWPAGWYDDYETEGHVRYWNGVAWTAQTWDHENGVWPSPSSRPRGDASLRATSTAGTTAPPAPQAPEQGA